jgi:hypothetical protein
MDTSQNLTSVSSEPNQSLKEVYGNLTEGDNWMTCSKYGHRMDTPDKLSFERIARTEQEIEHIKQRLQAGKISRQK